MYSKLSFGDIYLQFYGRKFKNRGKIFSKLSFGVFSFMVKNLQLGDKCTQNCHLGTLAILTSVISNNHLSRGENLVQDLTWKSNNRKQNIVDKRRTCS